MPTIYVVNNRLTDFEWTNARVHIILYRTSDKRFAVYLHAYARPPIDSADLTGHATYDNNVR